MSILLGLEAGGLQSAASGVGGAPATQGPRLAKSSSLTQNPALTDSAGQSTRLNETPMWSSRAGLNLPRLRNEAHHPGGTTETE